MLLFTVSVLASVPAKVMLLFTVNVLVSAIVNVALVNGEVNTILLMLVAVAAPKVGVTKVGLVANTKLPTPVSSVTAARKFALEGVAKNVAIFEPNPATPVDIGNPVQFVKTPAEGVSKLRALNKLFTVICFVMPVC